MHCGRERGEQCTVAERERGEQCTVAEREVSNALWQRER